MVDHVLEIGKFEWLYQKRVRAQRITFSDLADIGPGKHHYTNRSAVPVRPDPTQDIQPRAVGKVDGLRNFFRDVSSGLVHRRSGRP